MFVQHLLNAKYLNHHRHGVQTVLDFSAHLMHASSIVLSSDWHLHGSNYYSLEHPEHCSAMVVRKNATQRFLKIIKYPNFCLP